MRTKLATIATVAALTVLTGCTYPAADAAAPAPVVAPEPVTFAAAGDSITAWIDRNGVPSSETWVSLVGPNVEFTGEGWAKGGAQLAEIAANTTPVSADVLVVMAGTNDLGPYGTPVPERMQLVAQIAAAAGAPHVLIAAVPPIFAPEWAVEHNAALLHLATVNGWGFVDPWVAIRDDAGNFIPGYSDDQVHPTVEGARLAGAVMSKALSAYDPK